MGAPAFRNEGGNLANENIVIRTDSEYEVQLVYVEHDRLVHRSGRRVKYPRHATVYETREHSLVMVDEAVVERQQTRRGWKLPFVAKRAQHLGKRHYRVMSLDVIQLRVELRGTPPLDTRKVGLLEVPNVMVYEGRQESVHV
jgi:hypothetical protein